MKHRYIWGSFALISALGSIAWSANNRHQLVSLPANTVLRVSLNDTVGSDRSRPGDRFTATVDDRSLPVGTRIQGVVIGVRRPDGKTPGRIGLDFRMLELPDGQRVAITGTPTGLDSNSVGTASNGRLVAKSHSRNNTAKYVAYGAVGGLLIGSLVGKNVLGGLVGAGAGYLLGKNKDKKAKNRDVVLKEGTRLGVRLDRRVMVRRA